MAEIFMFCWNKNIHLRLPKHKKFRDTTSSTNFNTQTIFRVHGQPYYYVRCLQKISPIPFQDYRWLFVTNMIL